MKIFYHKQFNIDFGFFSFLHPFDGVKFRRVFNDIKGLPGVDIVSPAQAMPLDTLKKYADRIISRLYESKQYILRALEIPQIPLVPFSFLDRKILLPMRWGVAATLEAARLALTGVNCWNMAGGYHHASRASCEGFCIYNDINLAVQELREEGKIDATTRILIIDVDAHHGNGNANTFREDKAITIVDQFNDDIYPRGNFSKQRVDIPLPVHSNIDGETYLQVLRGGLQILREKVAQDGTFALAFVVAGTDVLIMDQLGRMNLSIEECIERDVLIADTLKELAIPFVFMGGGGYSKDSALAIAGSIRRLYRY
ncbi:MAG: Acetoin utilization protein AcuC [Pseudomonadota bacterium]